MRQAQRPKVARCAAVSRFANHKRGVRNFRCPSEGRWCGDVHLCWVHALMRREGKKVELTQGEIE
jgi:hypothetical protein